MIGSMLMLPVFLGRAWVPGRDSYYHMAMARHPVELGMSDTFPWLYWTIFRDVFVNHHLGFQFILYPWMLLSEWLTGELVPGGQAAVLFFVGCTSLCTYRILIIRRVPHPLLWTALLGVLPWHFWLRQGYVRAPIVALPMLIICIELIMRRRPIMLGIWAFLFMQIYFGAVVFGLLAGCLLFGMLIKDGWSRQFFYLGIATGAGLLTGLLLHPSFPHNIEFLRIQIFETGLSAAPDIGSEWKSPNPWFALKLWWPILLIWFTAMLIRFRQRLPLDGTSLGFLFLTIAFMLLTCKARRFVEYAPVFMLLSAADLARTDFMQRLNTVTVPGLRHSLTVVFILAVLSGPVLTRMNTRPPFHIPSIKPAMDWLMKYTPENSLVLADDWDSFPGLFHFNRHSIYAVGLDPMFTARLYPEHWRRYREITRGRAESTPSGPHSVSMADIGSLFRADYVLVQKDHATFYRKLLESPRLFTLVYPENSDGQQQPSLAIFEVRKEIY